MYLITNGIIITEESILSGYDLLVKDDRINKIMLQGESEINDEIQVIDAAGGYISPGFIDTYTPSQTYYTQCEQL